MKRKQITLGIETAVGGGNISLLREGSELASVSGGVSRAEEILNGIEKLLVEAYVKLADIDQIAVSLGPGSFTGIRIGIATALGLKHTLSTRCVGVNILEAMSLPFPNENLATVVSLGRGNYAVQEIGFGSGPRLRTGLPYVVNEPKLIEILDYGRRDQFIFHKDMESITAGWPRDNFLICNEPLSTLIGKSAFAGKGTKDLKPLYLRNQ